MPNKNYENNSNDLKRMKARIGELSKYGLIIETPDLCDFMSIVHFVYWDQEEAYLNDTRAQISDKSENPEKYWVSKRREELEKKYLTLGETSNPFLSEINFKFEEPSNYTLLMLYVGTPFMKPLKRKEDRIILFKKSGVYVKNLRDKFTIQEGDKKDREFLNGWEKPALTHAFNTQKRDNPVSSLEDLFIKIKTLD